jgi:phosphomannomutase
VDEALDDLAMRYGVHATRAVTVAVNGGIGAEAVVEAIIAAPPNLIGGRRVVTVEDLRSGFDGLPPTCGVRLWLDGSARIVVRASGTEPKVKGYIEVVRQVPAEAGDPGDQRSIAEAVAAEIAGDLRDLMSAPGLTHSG